MASNLHGDVEVALSVNLRVASDGTVSLRRIDTHSSPVIMARPYSKAELAEDSELQGNRWHGGGVYVHGGTWGTPTSRKLEARADKLAGELGRLLDRCVKTWVYGEQGDQSEPTPAQRWTARRYVQNALRVSDCTKRELVGTWHGSEPPDGTWFYPDNSGEPLHTGYVFLGEHDNTRLYLVTEVTKDGA